MATCRQCEGEGLSSTWTRGAASSCSCAGGSKLGIFQVSKTAIYSGIFLYLTRGAASSCFCDGGLKLGIFQVSKSALYHGIFLYLSRDAAFLCSCALVAQSLTSSRQGNPLYNAECFCIYPIFKHIWTIIYFSLAGQFCCCLISSSLFVQGVKDNDYGTRREQKVQYVDPRQISVSSNKSSRGNCMYKCAKMIM